jgi:hypothetical protein
MFENQFIILFLKNYLKKNKKIIWKIDSVICIFAPSKK